jgi:asparagine synthase (glutamine-hydrolysing)
VFRYVGLVWDAASDEHCLAARRLIAGLQDTAGHWSTAVSEAGLHVQSTGLVDEAQVLPLDDGTGVILGALFRRTADGQITELSADEQRRVLRTGGRELIQKYWGNYVTFLAEPSGHIRWVMRGPAAGLPCLHARSDGIDLYFSYMDSVAGLLQNDVTFNWRYIARSIMGPALTPMTGLNEVSELLGGMCNRHESSRLTQFRYWCPVKAAEAAGPLRGMDEAVTALRDTVKYSVRAQASRFRRVAVSLSGGLDSSIVLASLQDAPAKPELVGLNYFAAGPDSDERYYARHAAHRARCELIEIERHGRIDLRQAVSPVRFECNPGFHTREADRIEPDAARSAGAAAVLKGHGGDELFCRHHTALYLVDLLREQGIRQPFWSLALHSAVMEGETVWVAAIRAMRDALVHRKLSMVQIYWRDQEQQSPLSKEIVESLLTDRCTEELDTDARPGRMWQATLAISRRPYYTPFGQDGDAESLSPLLSQPVIETCLRIPAWLQTTGKRDRSVARKAFAADVPPEIIARAGKGGADALARQIATSNLPFLRETLLDGELAKRGISDRVRLEAALSHMPGATRIVPTALLELFAVEMWLLAWTRHENRPPA